MSFPLWGKGIRILAPKREPSMAVLDHHDRPAHETNLCAAKFCLTWIGFFVAIGAFTYLVSWL